MKRILRFSSPVIICVIFYERVVIVRFFFFFFSSRRRHTRSTRDWSSDVCSSDLPLATPTQADDTAAILFTSGSTGPAKGVVYTHGVFAAQVEMLRATYGIEPGEIDLCTFPLFALFGPALGMTCVVPVMDPARPAEIDPRLTVDTLRRFG